jgi:adenylate kinase
MAARLKSILLFGPPGVGKGMQGSLLGGIPGFHHLATGDIFRSLDKESPLGRKFLEYSSQGLLVPDDLTIELWQDYVRGLIEAGKYMPERDLLVLDGIPRSLAQAEAIDAHIEVLRIVRLTAPDINEMVQRMLRRAQKEGRQDDADETVIRRRFDVYDEETAPVLDYYDAQLVSEIAAIATPAEVLMNVLDAVIPAYTANFGNPMGG